MNPLTGGSLKVAVSTGVTRVGFGVRTYTLFELNAIAGGPRWALHLRRLVSFLSIFNKRGVIL